MIHMNDEPNKLAELIDHTRSINDWSDEDVARRARASGYQFSKSNISRIRLTPIKNLSPDQSRALAAGLGVPIETVVRASLETLRIPIPSSSASPESAIQQDLSLSPGQREMLLAAIKAARNINTRDVRVRRAARVRKDATGLADALRRENAGELVAGPDEPFTGEQNDEDQSTQSTTDHETTRRGVGVRTSTTGAAGRGTRKAVDATPLNEGASVDKQDDYELARRDGETEDEVRERLGIPYE